MMKDGRKVSESAMSDECESQSFRVHIKWWKVLLERHKFPRMDEHSKRQLNDAHNVWTFILPFSCSSIGGGSGGARWLTKAKRETVIHFTAWCIESNIVIMARHATSSQLHKVSTSPFVRALGLLWTYVMPLWILMSYRYSIAMTSLTPPPPFHRYHKYYVK